MHTGHTKKIDDFRSLQVITLIRCIPDRAFFAKSPHKFLQVAFLNGICNGSFAAGALQLGNKLAAILPVHAIERRAVQRQHTTADFECCEVSRKENNAVAIGDRFLQVLQADEFGSCREGFVAGPAAQAHFDHRHAQRLEVLVGKLVTCLP